MLPKTNAYVKGCDGQTKLMYFLKEFDSESSYNKEYLKTKKIKIHGDEVTDF